MKNILVSAVLLTTAVPVFASSTADLHSTIIKNTETNEAFSLNTQTNKTVYRTETVKDTCYKKVVDGTQKVCHKFHGIHGLYNLVPNTPTHAAHPSEPICHDGVVYKNVAYSCEKAVSVPYEVLDHYSTAHVNVKVSAAPLSMPQAGNCGINFNLIGDSLTAINTCSDFIATAIQSSAGQGNEINYNYTIKIFDSQTVLAPLAGKLQDMHVDGDELLVQTGKLTGVQNVSLKLYVQRKRLFKNDLVLINRVLDAKEFSYEPINERTGNVRINLKKILGGFESNKKHVIQLNLDINLDSKTLPNTEALPSLHQQANITIY